jgi:hypothetical protein
MVPLSDPLVASSDEQDGRIIQQQVRANLSRSIDIWLRRTHSGGNAEARTTSRSTKNAASRTAA